MKQRVAVRAIIRKDGKTLLLRRANGREAIIGKFELPGGTLDHGEQPADALERHLQSATGLMIQTKQLYDVATYIDHDDRDTQYVFILYLVSLVSSGSKMRLNQNYNKYTWEKVSTINQFDLTESTQLLLGMSQQYFTTVNDNVFVDDVELNTSNNKHVLIYSDGGSRGNPGPSAAGFIIMDSYDHVMYEGGMYLGVTTNNQAEYHGVRLGLEKALEIGARSIDFRIDSLLVVNQMNQVYTIKNRELWPIHERIRELVGEFEKVTFTHVKREFNQLADGMVNKILNAHAEDKV